VTRDSIAEAAARFARDIGPHAGTKAVKGRAARRRTRGHELTILHDEGLYRHLRFRSPDHSGYWFDLITVPGTLVFQGDGDSYVFSRTEDMFAFFRGSSREERGINPMYWSEKLTIGGRNSVMRYDADLFEQRVKEYVVEAIRYGGAPRGIGKAVAEMFFWGDYSNEHDARRMLESFEHDAHYLVSCSCGAEAKLPDYGEVVTWQGRHRRQAQDGTHHKITDRRDEGFRFHDTWEWSFSDYDWWFLWACHAIVWGVARYDEAKQTAEAVAA